MSSLSKSLLSITTYQSLVFSYSSLIEQNMNDRSLSWHFENLLRRDGNLKGFHLQGYVFAKPFLESFEKLYRSPPLMGCCSTSKSRNSTPISAHKSATIEWRRRCVGMSACLSVSIPARGCYHNQILWLSFVLDVRGRGRFRTYVQRFSGILDNPLPFLWLFFSNT